MELRIYDGNVTADGNGLTIEGYVNEVGTLSRVMGKSKPFRERIEKGAFTRAIERARLQNRGVQLLLEHNKRNLLASTKNGSLELREDETGLWFKANIVDTTLGNDTYKLVKSGLIRNMSFGFANPTDKWLVESGGQVRSISDLDLMEISIVENPAYLGSSAEARNIEAPMSEAEIDLEKRYFELMELDKSADEALLKYQQIKAKIELANRYRQLNELK